MSLTLLTGGARSGKSALAVVMGKAWPGPVVVIATAQPRDDEMAERIRRHRAQRPPAWTTIEEPFDLEAAVSSASAGAFVLIDCLTLWVSNLIDQGRSDEEVVESAGKAAEFAAARKAPTAAVTNEVGLGIVPANPLARRYRDLLGTVNAMWAEAASRSFLVVAGRLLLLSDPELPAAKWTES